MRILPFLLLSFLLCGCADPYGACVKGGADIANAIKAAQPTVDQARIAGLLTVPEESLVQDYLKFANDADGVFLTCAANIHTTKAGTYTSCVNALSLAVGPSSVLSESIHIINPQGQQTVNGIMTGLVAGAASIATALGGA